MVCTTCQQVWYADDATFVKMRLWFDVLLEKGPMYGYFPKPSKCILVTKPDRYDLAKKVFKGSGIHVQVEGSKDTGIEINCEGTRHLGAAVGNSEFKHKFIKSKVDSWISTVKKLAAIATSQPHAAYAAFTHCLQGQWTFLSRATNHWKIRSELTLFDLFLDETSTTWKETC